MTRQSKLIPILREGVDVIKMIFFKELKIRLEQTLGGKKDLDINRFCGALINTLFGTPTDDDRMRAFTVSHRFMIDDEINAIAQNFPKLQIPLTDALRVQFLCDSLEGINNEGALHAAREKGILLVEREVPLPKNFVAMAKKLGVAHHILSGQTTIIN